ncbi:unnamed protein product, partial [Discosporangium mesarthrocarpum]
MGFAEVRAAKGLVFGTAGDLESAINWIMDHQQEDPDIDDPIPDAGKAAAAVSP